MFLKSLVAAAAVVTVAAGPAFADCSLSGDAQAGKSVANQCKACHELNANKPSRPTGPNIHDVFGRKAGSRDDFKHYSDGMKGAEAKGVVWDEANLDAYLADPGAFLNKVNGKEVGHAMAFKVGDAGKRKSVVAFLKAIKGNAACY